MIKTRYVLVTNVGTNNAITLFSVGQITRNPLIDVDRENQTIIIIEVEANDTVFNSTTDVIITVLDINDNFPKFFPYNHTEFLPENNGTDQRNAYNGSYIIGFSAIDADEGLNAELTYETIDSSDKFQIDSTSVSNFRFF